MEAKAQARHVRVTPMKARRVVDLIRGKQATEAIAVLQFAPQAASEPVLKVLESAIANARVKADKAAEAFDERTPVSYTHLRAHETGRNLVCRLLLEKKK